MVSVFSGIGHRIDVNNDGLAAVPYGIVIVKDEADFSGASAAGLGCTAAIEWDIGYPTTINDPAFTGTVRDLVSQTIGEPNIVDLEAPSMSAEDFSYYGRAVPSCFVLLGLKPKDQESYPSVHTPRFDFNDDALATGIRMMCRIALDADS